MSRDAPDGQDSRDPAGSAIGRPARSVVVPSIPAPASKSAGLRSAGNGISASALHRALVVGHIVVDLNLSGDDVRLDRVELGLDLRRQQALVVLVDGVIDPAVLKAEDLNARLPYAVLSVHERLVGRDVDVLERRGEDLAWEHVILVGVDANRQLSGISGRFEHALSGRTRRSVDDVGAAVDLGLSEFAALDRVVPGGRRRAG